MPDKILLFLCLRFRPDEFAQISQYPHAPPERSTLEALAEFLRVFLKLDFTPELRGVPSLEFVLAIEDVRDPRPPSVEDTIVFALEPLELRQAAELQEKIQLAQQEGRLPEAHVSVDLPIAPTDVWCPQEASFPLFGQRDLALAQINAASAAAKDAFGDDVNVVIVDQGINFPVLQSRFPGVNFVGGWIVDKYGRGGPPGPPTPMNPGTWPDGHGTKMAEMVLSVAPHANILDLPLLPSHILGLQGYLAWAAGIYWSLLGLIPWLRQFPRFRGPWVLCDAWAVYDLRDDPPPPSPFNYGQNPANGLNLAVTMLPLLGRADIVFAAGNCGQFCPDGRCGAGEIGPGRSIYGVAAINNVLSVSAVRCDEIWLGYSSQGPAPLNFASIKPDLCAPSQFAGPADWGRAYTGTSTACALTTGAMAAARSFPATRTLSPAALRARAIATASLLVSETVPNQRVGSGLIDIDALL
jgi:subtilisin family serine protease